MNTITTRLRRISHFAVTTLSLVALVISVSLAQGWGDIKPPVGATAANSYHVLYQDGSELTVGGVYTTGGVSYSVPPAAYDTYGDLWYSEGTVVYPDGSWEHFPVSPD